MRYGSGRCEQNVTLCNITMSTDNQDITIKLDVNTTFINTPEQSVTVMCAIHFFESDRVERRLPFVDQEVQFNFGMDYSIVFVQLNRKLIYNIVIILLQFAVTWQIHKEEM